MTSIIYPSVFLFGLIIGSFLNAVIYRLSTISPSLKGRSFCPKCKKSLTWYELVPVFSFVLQRGKCRGCGERISWQYPLVELSTAVLFMLVIFNFQFSIFNEFSIIQFSKIVFLWTVLSGLVVIFVYDLKHYIIPDKILFPLIFLVVAAHLFGVLSFEFWTLEFVSDLGFRVSNFQSALSALAIGSLASLPFFAIHAVSQGTAMGFGDVKFAFFMGLLLGYPAILAAMFISFTLGAIIGIGLILKGKRSMKSRMPFGPFLIAGTLIALFWGGEIISWYWGLLL